MLINEKEFVFVPNAIIDEEYRNSYYNLVYKVFGLDFNPWYYRKKVSFRVNSSSAVCVKSCIIE